MYLNDRGQSSNYTKPMEILLAHDFGEVLLPYHGGVELSHVFELTNETGDVMNIDKVVASCGCTSPTLSSDVLAPGETARISATVNATKPGAQRAYIHVAIAGSDVLTYSLAWNGRKINTFQAMQSSVSLHRATEVEIGLVVTSMDDSDSEPPLPRIETPQGREITIIVKPWRRIHASRLQQGIPTRWYTEVILRENESSRPGGRTSTDYALISCGESDIMYVKLDGRPWNEDFELRPLIGLNR